MKQTLYLSCSLRLTSTPSPLFTLKNKAVSTPQLTLSQRQSKLTTEATTEGGEEAAAETNDRKKRGKSPFR
ncbi:hypothetical protein E2C01_004896 [Portunus trituberculatus]|uniref:Uncharacterized protein n=1 Tax=Portunus trituberculatus TaxID=210409 RepID=A0A5B7CQW8_PORTR|nr:hypothetical protein [Portunus trituberculatus]